MLNIKVEDFGSPDKVRKELERINRAADREMKREMTNVWNKVYREAISNCPIDTGTLVSSIKQVNSNTGSFDSGNEMTQSTFSISGKSASIFNGMITVGDDSKINPKNKMTSAQYAALIHDGHFSNGKWVEGVPFLTDAIDKYSDEIEKASNRAIVKSIGE